MSSTTFLDGIQAMVFSTVSQKPLQIVQRGVAGASC